ncbi:hypothetical protein BgiBS90_015173, partial [Biomphalaria glabrata]
ESLSPNLTLLSFFYGLGIAHGNLSLLKRSDEPQMLLYLEADAEVKTGRFDKCSHSSCIEALRQTIGYSYSSSQLWYLHNFRVTYMHHLSSCCQG